jgi:hypothetical protein
MQTFSQACLHALLDLRPHPEVWSVDPRTGTASLIFNFRNEDAGISSCFGITEVSKDIFTVVTGQFDVGTFSASPGSFSV